VNGSRDGASSSPAADTSNAPTKVDGRLPVVLGLAEAIEHGEDCGRVDAEVVVRAYIPPRLQPTTLTRWPCARPSCSTRWRSPATTRPVGPTLRPSRQPCAQYPWLRTVHRNGTVGPVVGAENRQDEDGVPIAAAEVGIGDQAA
jgi:hypothetical protein